MKIGLVYARAANGVIGKAGVLPWHLPEDLAHFRQVTMGAPVVMGRKTWESLPPRFRPLPGRRNIVVTRRHGWQAPGAELVHSLPEALALCASEPQVWVIGGAEIFAQAMPLAHVLEVTEIDRDFEGDVTMPEPGAQWVEAGRERHRAAAGFDYSFVTYTQSERGA
jgi:dihydrofolate reductase